MDNLFPPWLDSRPDFRFAIWQAYLAADGRWRRIPKFVLVNPERRAQPPFIPTGVRDLLDVDGFVKPEFLHDPSLAPRHYYDVFWFRSKYLDL